MIYEINGMNKKDILTLLQPSYLFQIYCHHFFEGLWVQNGTSYVLASITYSFRYYTAVNSEDIECIDVLEVK